MAPFSCKTLIHVFCAVRLNTTLLFGLRPRSHETGGIFVQIRLAFTRDPRNRTNSNNANRMNSRPKKIRSRFLRDRSQILRNPCKTRNPSFSGLICTVGNWNELDNAMKPGLSNKHEVLTFLNQQQRCNRARIHSVPCERCSCQNSSSPV